MKNEKHIKIYRAAPVGGQAVCSCGFESPIVDDSVRFGTGIKGKTVDDYFDEHLQKAQKAGVENVETTMREPAAEQAVAPAQRANTVFRRRGR